MNGVMKNYSRLIGEESGRSQREDLRIISECLQIPLTIYKVNGPNSPDPISLTKYKSTPLIPKEEIPHDEGLKLYISEERIIHLYEQHPESGIMRKCIEEGTKSRAFGYLPPHIQDIYITQIHIHNNSRGDSQSSLNQNMNMNQNQNITHEKTREEIYEEAVMDVDRKYMRVNADNEGIIVELRRDMEIKEKKYGEKLEKAKTLFEIKYKELKDAINVLEVHKDGFEELLKSIDTCLTMFTKYPQTKVLSYSDLNFLINDLSILFENLKYENEEEFTRRQKSNILDKLRILGENKFKEEFKGTSNDIGKCFKLERNTGKYILKMERGLPGTMVDPNMGNPTGHINPINPAEGVRHNTQLQPRMGTLINYNRCSNCANAMHVNTRLKDCTPNCVLNMCSKCIVILANNNSKMRPRNYI